jgi:hypothetical protein
MTPEELKETLRLHVLWLAGKPEGRRADLSREDLRGMDFREMDFRGAVMRGADMRAADFRGAHLPIAYFCGADLREADFREAYLIGADFCGADMAGAKFDAVPAVPDLDAHILGVIESGAGAMDMSVWHTCETTHCRAGWAITFAGEAGAELERRFGPSVAGALIYAASCPDEPVPDFFASGSDALDDIRRRAEKYGGAQ